jgi:hypothetical protein
MKIAWFRPSATGIDANGDHLADVIGALGATHAIECVDERLAHEFVWRHARGAFDLCVYELDNTARHQYMWPYLLHYPGVLALQAASVHDSRRARLVHEGRQADYRAEIAFAGGPSQVRPPWHMARGRWPMLGIPVAASRVTAVTDQSLADYLTASMPGARVCRVVAGVAERSAAVRPETPGPVTVAVAEPARGEVVVRAVGRLAADGVEVAIAQGDAIGLAEVVVAMRWPEQGRPLVSALRALASGRPTIVAETPGTADWPALDPQTWRPRDSARTPDAPVVISVDPRDEEHSLVLALRRLATDVGLRAELGRAARAWWATHASIDRAAASWRAVLADATGCPPPTRPEGWPRHLDADGSSLTRQILAECGVETVPWQGSP